MDFDLQYDPFEFGVEQLMLRGYDRDDAVDIYKKTHTVEEGGDIVTTLHRPEEEIIQKLNEEGSDSDDVAELDHREGNDKKGLARKKSALGEQWTAMAHGGNTGVKEKDDVAHEITRRKSFVVGDHGTIEDNDMVMHMVSGNVHGANTNTGNKKMSHGNLHEGEVMQRNEIVKRFLEKSGLPVEGGVDSDGGDTGGTGGSTSSRNSFNSDIDWANLGAGAGAVTSDPSEKSAADYDPKDNSKEARAARRKARESRKTGVKAPYTEDDEAQIEKIMVAGYSRILAEEQWDQMKKRGERPRTPEGLKTHVRCKSNTGSRSGSAANSAASSAKPTILVTTVACIQQHRMSCRLRWMKSSRKWV